MSPNETPIWDLPTRLFHWLLAASFAVALATGDHDRLLTLHVLAGESILVLVAFRLVWGLVGTRHARFASFAYPPRAVKEYLSAILHRNRPPRYLGHNPPGGWAVFALLALVTVVSLLGLIALGGQERWGPLAGSISFRVGDLFKELHEAAAGLLLALVGIHLAGVLGESFIHRENLVAAMIHGRKRLDTGGVEPQPVETVSRLGLALATVAIVVTAVWLIPSPGSAVDSLPMDSVWQRECGDCHLPYHPSLLPARSWQAMLQSNPDDHFGEPLALDPALSRSLLAFATAHAAETEPTEVAHQVIKSTRDGSTPLRITETRYWKKKHRKIGASVGKRSEVLSPARCESCHEDARAGTFRDDAIHAPKGVSSLRPPTAVAGAKKFAGAWGGSSPPVG